MKIEIAESIIYMWIVMAILSGFALFVNIPINRGKFKDVPETKLQAFVEAFVEFIYNVARDTMGERNIGLAPYTGSLGLLIMLSNIMGMFGVEKPPTSDYSVTLGLALATFFVVQYHQFKAHTLKGYVKEIFEPIPLLFPLNLLDKFTPILSMSLRLFGNVTAGVIIMGLIYEALRGMNVYTMAIIPIPFHFYFDIFDGFIQTLVFVMLTMVLTANATYVDEDH